MNRETTIDKITSSLKGHTFNYSCGELNLQSFVEDILAMGTVLSITVTTPYKNYYNLDLKDCKVKELTINYIRGISHKRYLAISKNKEYGFSYDVRDIFSTIKENDKATNDAFGSVDFGDTQPSF